MNPYTAALIRQIRSITSLRSTAGVAVADCVAGSVTIRLRQCYVSRPSAHLISRLQSVMNAAARLIFSSREYDHVMPLLHQRHWLKMEQRIEYALDVLLFGLSALHSDGFFILRESTCTRGHPYKLFYRVAQLMSASISSANVS